MFYCFVLKRPYRNVPSRIFGKKISYHNTNYEEKIPETIFTLPLYHLTIYLGNSDARTVSVHDLSVNHLDAGLGRKLASPTPSVRKVVNNSSSSSPFR